MGFYAEAEPGVDVRLAEERVLVLSLSFTLLREPDVDAKITTIETFTLRARQRRRRFSYARSGIK